MDHGFLYCSGARRSRFMGETYSSKILGLVTRIAAVPIIVLLSMLSNKDKGSHEALCFNYMVRC